MGCLVDLACEVGAWVLLLLDYLAAGESYWA
jgi:hypothetical protein